MDNNRGLKKQSFCLPYNGGELWAEHLDAIADERDVRAKFTADLQRLDHPSMTSFVAVNLDETEVDEPLLTFLLDGFCAMKKPPRKLVFVGLRPPMKRCVKRRSRTLGFAVTCIDDFEEAKAWLI